VLSPGDRIQGYLAKPDGAGPFPAVIVLHCAGMHDTTKQKLVDELLSTAMRRDVSIKSANRAGLSCSAGVGQMLTGRWSSWLAKPSSIHSV
jgi:hypothetical protein